MQSRPEDARRFGHEAVAVARARGNPFELAEALSQAGLYISLTGDDPRGAALADESVDVARSLGNAWALATALRAAGITRYRSDPARAIVLLQEGFDVPSAYNDGVVRFMKSIAHLALGDEHSAATELLNALPRLQEVGEDYYQAMALAGAAVLLRRHGPPDVAVRILALNERLHADGRIVGVPRDLESQERLRERLECEVEPEAFAALWAEGRAMTLDTVVAQTLDQLKPIAESE